MLINDIAGSTGPTIMSLIRFITSRKFFKHLIIALALTVVLLVVVLFSLNSYTRHGKAIEMPDLTGQQLEELTEWKDQGILDFVVTDSVHTDEMPGGAVFMQDPYPGSMIKKGRKVYITLVARSEEKISLPDLTDLTVRQAMAVLENYGLTVDSLIFVPDVGKTVISTQINGEEAESGKKIAKGTKVQLVVGRGKSNERVQLPFLIGKSREDAMKVLAESYLNIRAEFYPEDSDSTNVVVARQKPAYRSKARIPMGGGIDLWYEDAEDFDLNDAMLQLGIDSLQADSLMRTDTIKTDTSLLEF